MSDDELEDGTTDRTILLWFKESRYCESVPGRVRGCSWARPPARLGCLACKHLTWIFSLVSPASAREPRLQSSAQAALTVLSLGTITFLSWARRVARLCLAGSGSSLSVSFSENFTRSVDWAGPEPSPEDQDQDWRDSVTADPSSWHHCEPLSSILHLPASVTQPRYGQIINLYSDNTDLHPSSSQGRAENEREKNYNVLHITLRFSLAIHWMVQIPSPLGARFFCWLESLGNFVTYNKIFLGTALRSPRNVCHGVRGGCHVGHWSLDSWEKLHTDARHARQEF